MFDLSAAAITLPHQGRSVELIKTPRGRADDVVSRNLNKVPGKATLRSGPGTLRPATLTHLVRRDGELLGAVHHLRRPVFGATQSLAALVQSLAGLLHGARHAVGGRVQDAVAWR